MRCLLISGLAKAIFFWNLSRAEGKDNSASFFDAMNGVLSTPLPCKARSIIGPVVVVKSRVSHQLPRYVGVFVWSSCQGKQKQQELHTHIAN